MKINDCLERTKDRLVLVIQPESVIKDIEDFLKHDLLCKFMGMRISLQFLETRAHRTWAPEGEMEIMLLVNI